MCVSHGQCVRLEIPAHDKKHAECYATELNNNS